MSQYVPGWRKLLQLPAKLVLRSSVHGVHNCLAWCWYQGEWRWREWRLGIDTREFAHGTVVDEQGMCNGYEPIDYRCFEIIMDYLQPGDQDVFLDYGCGMGRAVVLAATRSWRRVIGVEIDERLANIARGQVQRARSRGHLSCPDVQIIAADASQWSVPAEVTCVFLFNSFVGELLAAVLEQVRQSVAWHPRPLKVVYMQPIVDRDMLAECSWLRELDRLPTGFWTHVRTVVYESRDSGA